MYVRSSLEAFHDLARPGCRVGKLRLVLDQLVVDLHHCPQRAVVAVLFVRIEGDNVQARANVRTDFPPAPGAPADITPAARAASAIPTRAPKDRRLFIGLPHKPSGIAEARPPGAQHIEDISSTQPRRARPARSNSLAKPTAVALTWSDVDFRRGGCFQTARNTHRGSVEGGEDAPTIVGRSFRSETSKRPRSDSFRRGEFTSDRHESKIVEWPLDRRSKLLRRERYRAAPDRPPPRRAACRS